MSKRPLPADDEDLRFRITFDQVAPVRQLLEILGSILGRITFRLVPCEGVVGTNVWMLVDSVDSFRVALAQAKIGAKGVLTQGEVVFCLDSDARHVPAQRALPLLPLHVRLPRLGGRHVCATDQLSGEDVMQFELTSIDQECDSLPWTRSSFPLRPRRGAGAQEDLKLATELNSENVDFVVQKEAHKAGKVKICAKGDAHFKRDLPRSSEVDQEVDTSPTVLDYVSSFKLAYGSKFVRGMESTHVMMKFGEGTPLFVHYDLGTPESFVRFVLAPKSGEEE